MAKILVIFTYEYPYNPPTECFLDVELKYIKICFDKIIIIPTKRNINKTNSYISKIDFDTLEIKRKHKIFEFLLGFIANTFVNKNFWIDIMLTININANIKNIYEILKGYVSTKALFYQIRFKLCGYLNNDDEVLLYSYWFNNNAIVAVYIKEYLINRGFLNVKTVARAHGDGDLYLDYRTHISLINKYIDKVFVISKMGASYLINSKISSQIVEINRLGVEIKPLNNFKVASTYIIVSCSVLNDNKRVNRIISSLSLLSNEKITWVHFGDGVLMRQLQELCKNKLPANIKWELRGSIPNEQIIKFYHDNQPSLFINVSSIEGIPVSIMEAMSCGIPVVATDVGATNEIVENNINGYLLNKNFEDVELANIIKLNYHKKDKYDSMSINAYNKCNKYFNAKINYSDFVKICSGMFVN